MLHECLSIEMGIVASFGSVLVQQLHHSAIGRSPFETLYGYTPHPFGVAASDAVCVQELSHWIDQRRVMDELIKQHLSHSKLHMKKQTDKH